MHIAATSPLALTAEEIDAAVIERERAIFTEQAKETGKPDAVIEKMVTGRLQKFFKESVLLKQEFVIDHREDRRAGCCRGGKGCRRADQGRRLRPLRARRRHREGRERLRRRSGRGGRGLAFRKIASSRADRPCNATTGPPVVEEPTLMAADAASSPALQTSASQAFRERPARVRRPTASTPTPPPLRPAISMRPRLPERRCALSSAAAISFAGMAGAASGMDRVKGRLYRHARDGHECHRARQCADQHRRKRRHPFGNPRRRRRQRASIATKRSPIWKPWPRSSFSPAAPAILSSRPIRRLPCAPPKWAAMSFSRRRRLTAFIPPIPSAIRMPSAMTG